MPRTATTESGLTVKQEEAIEALLAHRTHKEAAASIGVTTRAIRYYLASPLFLDRLRKASGEHFAATIARMKTMARDAAETMYEQMTADVPNVDKVAVASAILNHVVKFVAMDVEARLQELEARLGGGGAGRGGSRVGLAQIGQTEVLMGPVELDGPDGEDTGNGGGSNAEGVPDGPGAGADE